MDLRASLEGYSILAEAQALSPLNNKENDVAGRYLKHSPIRQKPFIQHLKQKLEDDDYDGRPVHRRSQSFPLMVSEPKPPKSKDSDWLNSLDYEMGRLLAENLVLDEELEYEDSMENWSILPRPTPKQAVVAQLHKLKLLMVTSSKVPPKEVEVSHRNGANYRILLAQYNALARQMVEKNNEINLVNFKQTTLINDLIYYINEKGLERCRSVSEKDKDKGEEGDENENREQDESIKIPLRQVEGIISKNELITDETIFNYSKDIIDGVLMKLDDTESLFDSTFHSNPGQSDHGST